MSIDIEPTPEPLNMAEVIASSPRLRERLGTRMATTTASQDSLDGGSFRLKVLAAIRESDEYDYALLDGMVAQVLEPLMGTHPELGSLLSLGAQVMKTDVQGQQLRKDLGAIPLFGLFKASNRPTAWAVDVGECRIIYGLVSAGKTSSATGSDNAWVNVLSGQIKELRPQQLHTGPFNRLLRNKDLASQLRIPLGSVGTKLFCSEVRAGFVLGEQSGDLIWELLSQAAHTDWITTLTRLQMGSLNDLKNNRLPRGSEIPIPGYRQKETGEGKKRSVIPDEDQRAQVRAIIETAASGMTEIEAAKLLAKLGICSRQQIGKDKLATPIDQVDNVPSAVRRLWQHLPTYATGKYTYHQRNTVPGIKEMHGQAIHRTSDTDNGEFRFELNFGLPNEPWHEPEVIKLAIIKRLTPHPKNAGVNPIRAAIKPLSGLGSRIVGGYEYRLMCDEKTYYMRRRPYEPSSGSTLRGFKAYEGELIGRFSTKALHKAVAQMLRSTTEGVQTALPCSHAAESDPIIMEDFRERLLVEEGLAARLRQLAASSKEGDESQAYQHQAHQHHVAARELRQQIQDLENIKHRTDNAFLADTDQILIVAELLDRCEDLAPFELRQRLKGIITSLTFEDVELNKPLATLKMTISLRTSEGVIPIGPLSCSIVNTSGRGLRRAEPSAAHPRNIQLAYELISGNDGDVIRILEGLNSRSEHRRMIQVMNHLMPTIATSRAIIACPISTVRRIVFGEVFKNLGLEGFPIEGRFDPKWIEEIKSVYLHPSASFTAGGWALKNWNWARETLSWIQRNYDPEMGVPLPDLRNQLGLADAQIYALLNTDPTKYKGACPGDTPPLEPTTKWLDRQPMDEVRHVRLPWCEHCKKRTLPHILQVPELPQGWLCTECRRPPGSKIVYPLEYLKPWVGGQQGRHQTRSDEEQAAHALVGTRLKPFVVPPRKGPLIKVAIHPK